MVYRPVHTGPRQEEGSRLQWVACGPLPASDNELERLRPESNPPADGSPSGWSTTQTDTSASSIPVRNVLVGRKPPSRRN